MRDGIATSKGAVGFENIKVAEDAPEAVEGGVFMTNRHRIFEVKSDVVLQLGLETREERGKSFLVVGKINMAPALIVIQFAYLAELELGLLLSMNGVVFIIIVIAMLFLLFIIRVRVLYGHDCRRRSRRKTEEVRSILPISSF